MLKAEDLARQEDRRVRGSKTGKPDKIGGYHMYAFRVRWFQRVFLGPTKAVVTRKKRGP